MKKLLTIFLVFVFSLSAIGLQVTVHHCMGKTSFTVFGIDFNKDCKCKHQEENHKSRCCNSHTLTLRAFEDPYTSPYYTNSFQQVLIEKISMKEQISISAPVLINTKSIAFAHAPPRCSVSLNTLFCLYRV